MTDNQLDNLAIILKSIDSIIDIPVVLALYNYFRIEAVISYSIIRFVYRYISFREEFYK